MVAHVGETPPDNFREWVVLCEKRWSLSYPGPKLVKDFKVQNQHFELYQEKS